MERFDPDDDTAAGTELPTKEDRKASTVDATSRREHKNNRSMVICCYGK